MAACAASFEFRMDLSIGTRPSPLAVVQAETVAAALSIANPGTMTSIVPIHIEADQTSEKPLSSVDFTSDLDERVLDGALSLAVHSLKDLPPNHRWKGGLVIGCHLPRASPLDVLIGVPSLDDLPRGARVGTASVRRRAQLMAHRPDLSVVSVRGTVTDRLSLLDRGEVDALVLAQAGLARLGVLEALGARQLPPEAMLPGAWQGIICAVCRRDADALRVLRAADDEDAHVAASAERALLDVVDAGSAGAGRPPLGAYMARDSADGTVGVGLLHGWTLRGMLCRADGTGVVRVAMHAPPTASVAEAATLGRLAGEALLERAHVEWEGMEAAKAAAEEGVAAAEEGVVAAEAAEAAEGGAAREGLMRLRGGDDAGSRSKCPRRWGLATTGGIGAAGGAAAAPRKLVRGWGGGVAHLGLGAAMGAAVGFGAGCGVLRASSEFRQQLRSQLALTLTLRALGIVRIDWARVRALGGCVLRVPLGVVRACLRGQREAQRREREAAKWEVRLPRDNETTGSDEGGGLTTHWVEAVCNEHTAAGGIAGFAAGLWVGVGHISHFSARSVEVQEMRPAPSPT
jgi:hydroxymethylbilane synthase